MKEEPIISFWLSDGIAWIKPTGEGCILNAPKLKAFAKETIRRGHYKFVLDLGECTGLDEDFMGTLAGIALRLRDLDRGKVEVVGCPPELGDKLRSLGLDRLLDM